MTIEGIKPNLEVYAAGLSRTDRPPFFDILRTTLDPLTLPPLRLVRPENAGSELVRCNPQTRNVYLIGQVKANTDSVILVDEHRPYDRTAPISWLGFPDVNTAYTAVKNLLSKKGDSLLADRTEAVTGIIIRNLPYPGPGKVSTKTFTSIIRPVLNQLERGGLLETSRIYMSELYSGFTNEIGWLLESGLTRQEMVSALGSILLDIVNHGFVMSGEVAESFSLSFSTLMLEKKRKTHLLTPMK